MGWRGYVLPRLQARYGALAGSLLLATIFHATGNTAGFFLPLAGNTGAQAIAIALITAAASAVTAASFTSLRTGPSHIQEERL